MPMGDYTDFDQCVRRTRLQHPDWSEERCRRYCGSIYWKTEGKGRRAGRRSRRR